MSRAGFKIDAVKVKAGHRIMTKSLTPEKRGGHAFRWICTAAQGLQYFSAA